MQHALGTDLLGRDILSRALHGGQRTIGIGAASSLIGFTIGMFIGTLNSVAGQWAKFIISAILNALLAFPGLVLALITLTLMGSGVFSIIIAVAVIQIAPCARITHSAVIQLKQREYVQAAHSLGSTQVRTLIVHILPNALPALLTYLGTTFSYCLLSSAALTFLGFGGDPSVPDWGMMLYDGRLAFRSAPWIGFVPGSAITLTVLFVNWILQRINPTAANLR
jgi:peptide/nickel transport system permease protein